MNAVNLKREARVLRVSDVDRVRHLYEAIEVWHDIDYKSGADEARSVSSIASQTVAGHEGQARTELDDRLRSSGRARRAVT